ncbi:MAG: methyltransferase domain-containing protein [Thermodesulfovibrionales bacterium]|nr:methyltransferase domain-containing protein [Thermodesulfovibrionales bacterium]
MEKESFWHIRSEHYDKLFWTKDVSYIDAIIDACGFDSGDLVLDVGTGTGAIARAIQPMVSHVVALDNSSSMLDKGRWEGFSAIKWDIADRVFKDGLFDKVVARMVFHHIFDNLDKVFVRCFDLLKNSGKLVVAEGVPPTDDPDVVQWYTDMFRYKEERRVFTPGELIGFFEKNGFLNVKCNVHTMSGFSIRNWLENSGIEKDLQEKIMDMHVNAPDGVKEVYNMKITKDDCLVDTRNVIVTGDK